ncbi:putative ATP-dependent RNA helicase TDRD12 [Ostrinia furnacalis]|uniref:putative ATP-dependent RNA helicase TDRD12 n=1 Tax=Ostrinia furnacalis TaxID=93504 RepID=UPI00103B3DAE|nr:putative ATP-dependent RNA helicase TDRD12 [Ostrinia furnacalis]
MGPDRYLVEVLHYRSPHLIWVEVVSENKEYNYEQLGIYGILPFENSIDLESGKESTVYQRCRDWVPAVTLLMQETFADANEVWFCPTHIDRRNSIFDDNIHKYGEITIIKKDKQLFDLSKVLTKSGLAIENIVLFHQELSLGNLNTKLDHLRTQEVVKEIEKHIALKPSKKREESVKKHTTVFQAAQNLESMLTSRNLERHNEFHLSGVKIDHYMKMKSKDFDKCKDIDEVSVGRASHVSKSVVDEPTLEPTPEPTKLPKFLQKKLELSRKPCLKSANDPMQVLLATKKYLEENAVKIDDHRNNSEDGSFSNAEDKIKIDDHRNNSEDLSSNTGDKNATPNVGDAPEKPVMVDKRTNTGKGYFLRRHKRVLKNKKNEIIFFKSYGPPGMSPNTRTLKEKTKEEQEEQDQKLVSNTEDRKEVANDVEFFDDVDSHIELEITNKDDLKEMHKQNAPKDTEVNKNDSFDSTDKSLNESNCSTDSKRRHEGLQKFSAMRKKLELLKNKSKSDVSFSSDSYKDSSSDINASQTKRNKAEFLDSDDDTLTDLVEKISVEYRPKCLKTDVKPKETVKVIPNAIKNNVNPFKNVDADMSVFVDKLVSPVLMVHCKNDKRIEPCSNIRDIHFNDHIHVVLKNYGVERPMMLQMVSWPVILRGYSFFMISPKNSGKTLGYLPAVCRLISDFRSEFVDSVGPTCIIVCATAQSVSEVEKLAKMMLALEEKVVACYPGMDELHMTTSLLNGCDLFICTPSVLVRLLQLTDFGIDLRRLSTFVLEDCERLSQVYSNEVKFFLVKIKEMLKNRANKEMKVQFVVLSRVWCDFLEPLAKKSPNSVICIGAFQECVLYSKASTSVDFVKKENKKGKVLEYLKEIDGTKSTVIVCRSDDEVDDLKNELTKNKNVVFSCDNKMTVEDLYNLSKAWHDYQEPLLGPILVCCDGNLNHLNVTNAHHLIHYSLPGLFSMFCKRFSVLNDNYSSIFKTENEAVKIKVFLEDSNVEQLPKILNFIKRCTDQVPEFLDKICETILHEKDAVKAKNLVPICCNLLEYGECPDYWNCHDRHAVFKNCDEPKDWMPKSGVVTFKILHYLTPLHYSARLLSNITKGQTRKYPQAYSSLSLKLGMYFSHERNQRLHGIPKVGDVCAVSVKINFFVRCQVLKILSKYNNGTPNEVLIKLIDEEKLEKSRDIYLYYLPEEFKSFESHVVQVRLVNICPRDKDITFSNEAKKMLMKITKEDEDLYLRGQVVLTVGNCIFVDTLEACQELTSLNETVVRYNFKKELLDKHAIANPEHIGKLEKLCEGCIERKDERDAIPEESVIKQKKDKATPQWAHLEQDMTEVFFASADDPNTLFLRLVKFESCMKLMLKDIEKHVAEKPEPVSQVAKGDIVLAKFPDDSTYERARVEEILSQSLAKCFFVDQGDWRDVLLKDLVDIPDKFIKQLPFQAIECSLIGIKPVGENWTDYAINWLCDKCETNSGDPKQLYVKYFTKEESTFTGGNKYGVAIVDTYGDGDVVINKLMVDLNLAQETEEMEYLDQLVLSKPVEPTTCKETSDNEFEEVSKTDDNVDSQALVPAQDYRLSDLFPEKPIRSVPLVGSDDDSDGSWSIHDPHEFLPMVKDYFDHIKNMNQGKNENDAQASTSTKVDEKPKETKKDDTQAGTSTNVDEKPTETKKNETQAGTSTKVDEMPTETKKDEAEMIAKKNADLSEAVDESNAVKSLSTTLDSDDLSSAEGTQVSEKNEKTNPPINLIVDELRKPKLCWRQNKTSVTIKIQLIGVENYDLDVKERSIKFDAESNDTQYGFDIELYGVIDGKSVVHSNKGQYILVKMNKVMKKNWLSLTKDNAIKKWIVYDVDNLDASSEEEENYRDTLADVMKGIHNRESDSESDEDFLDDLGYEYKRDIDSPKG